MNSMDNRKSKFIGGVRNADRTLLVTGTGNVQGNRRQSVAMVDQTVTQPAVRGVINGAMARSKELRRQARRAALQDAVDNLKSKSGRGENLTLEEIIPADARHRSHSRGSIDTDEYRDDYDDESTDKSGSGFMNTFRTAVQRAYDAVGDPEKEGVNQDDITDILSKLGYSSEDRETQNILSQAAVMTTNNQNMKFQEVFKLVVGRNEEETLADITNAFEIFDRDDDGKLQTKDLHRALTRIGDDPLTEEEFTEILSLAELDPDFEAFFDYKDLTNHKLALSYASKTAKSEESICVS